MGNIRFIVIKAGKSYDMSNLIESIVWSGRRGSAARSIKAVLLDDDGYGHDRCGINCEKGHKCIFYWKNKELFRGLIMNQSYSNKKLTITAYDSGIYLANSKDSFNYKNKKASEIFLDCMKRLKIEVGNIADTTYKIPELPKKEKTFYDVICDALSLTYKATGERYYPISMKGKLSLLERKKEVLQWVIEPETNLNNFSYSKSVEDIKTRIRLLSDKGKLIAEEKNSSLEKTFGIFQDIEKAKDKLNTAQLKQMAENLLKKKGGFSQKFSITALGIPDVYAGKCIYIKVPELSISRTFFIDEDSHTFKGNYHSMKLTLNYIKNITKME